MLYPQTDPATSGLSGPRIVSSAPSVLERPFSAHIIVLSSLQGQALQAPVGLSVSRRDKEV